MRRRVLIFLLVVLFCLAVAPITNFLTRKNLNEKSWLNKKFLYNMDFTSKWLSLALYQIGISTDPGQVVIGREGWLFLGDNYKQSQTVSRRGKTSDDLIIGQKIGDATIAWDHWLASKGVRLFRVMIGPNKETIYPEYLPMWAKPSSPTATGAPRCRNCPSPRR